jgi:hypothetical protein
MMDHASRDDERDYAASLEAQIEDLSGSSPPFVPSSLICGNNGISGRAGQSESALPQSTDHRLRLASAHLQIRVPVQA